MMDVIIRFFIYSNVAAASAVAAWWKEGENKISCAFSRFSILIRSGAQHKFGKEEGKEKQGRNSRGTTIGNQPDKQIKIENENGLLTT